MKGVHRIKYHSSNFTRALDRMCFTVPEYIALISRTRTEYRALQKRYTLDCMNEYTRKLVAVDSSAAGNLMLGAAVSHELPSTDFLYIEVCGLTRVRSKQRTMHSTQQGATKGCKPRILNNRSNQSTVEFGRVIKSRPCLYLSLPYRTHADRVYMHEVKVERKIHS